jgi:exodeoxyribonuclease VII large subunit
MPVLNQTPSNIPEYSVSELSGAIKKTLESGFSQVRVRAECGRVTIAKSGHIYFDLKDDKAVINAIIWAGTARNLKTKPEEGLEVVATGRITTFEGQSRYQIIIDKIEPAGMGAILAQLEERRKKLAAEGLFDTDRKKPIPYLPQTIGVVTSPTGAVIRDILHRITERFPTHILLWGVLVQGDKAAAQIVHAIEGFNALPIDGEIPRPELLIVARGGGSIEDLWCFNDESVVRAVAASDIPIISAVGHETDTTLIDYASDLRAPTPTGAAEKAVPVRAELDAHLSTTEGRLKSALLRRLNNAKLELSAVTSTFPKGQDLFAYHAQQLDNIDLRLLPALQSRIAKSAHIFATTGTKFGTHLLRQDLRLKEQNLVAIENRLTQGIKAFLRHETLKIERQKDTITQIFARLLSAFKQTTNNQKVKLESIAGRLNILDYKNVLKRGFALVQDKNQQIIKSAEAAKNANELNIIFADSAIIAQLKPNKPEQGNLF